MRARKGLPIETSIGLETEIAWFLIVHLDTPAENEEREGSQQIDAVRTFPDALRLELFFPLPTVFILALHLFIRQPLQQQPCAMDAGLHGSYRNLHNICDLLILEAVIELIQQQRSCFGLQHT